MKFAVVDTFKTVWNQSPLLAINFIKIDLDLISLSREEGCVVVLRQRQKARKQERVGKQRG